MTPAQATQAIADKLVEFQHDPLGFTLYFYPWRQPGTFLENEDGPDTWQREQLEYIGAQLRSDPHTPIKMGTSSGNGSGKSALVAWLIHWAEMTHVRTRGVITANSDTQLKTKTWVEVAKWTELMFDQFPILRGIFTLTATRFYANDAELEWRIDAIPNNKGNPAAFSGLHNAGRRVLVIYDEASEIPDIIWDMTEGAMSDADTEILWLVFGNPTQPVGRFKDIFKGKLRDRWRTWKIDTRNVKRTNKAEIAGWIEAWGLDSDWVRTRVTGEFPTLGSMQLIGTSLVEAARRREPSYIPSDPLVAGLDIARFGDDASVLQPRRGRDAKTIPRKEWRGVDTMTLASEVAAWCMEFQPDALFVDVGGVGAGVYDRLIQLRVRNVYPVNFGSAGGITGMNGSQARTANKRATMWIDTREWLALGAIPDDSDLETDLTGVEYGYTADGAILLEKKEHMKSRGLASPDKGDALALTFAHPITPRRVAGSAEQLSRIVSGYDGATVNDKYDPYDEVR